METFTMEENGQEIRNTEKPCVVFTDKILKVVVCIVYGIMPNTFNSKAYSRAYSAFVVFLHWFSVGGYVYCNHMFWSEDGVSKINNATNADVGPTLNEISRETLFLLIGLSFSDAISVSMAVCYFYKHVKIHSGWQHFNLLPSIKTGDDGETPEKISKKDWLVTNLLLLLGFLSILFLLASNLSTNTMFDFHGIRSFLSHTTVGNKLIYYITFVMLFWGFASTVCACCLFHVMSRQLIAVVRHTKRHVLENVKTREQFFKLHKQLLKYKKQLVGKFEWWFVVHNGLYVVLVLLMIFEWFAFMKNSSYQNNFLVSQAAGTLLIGYKFVLPFLSASLVTIAFKDLYLSVARENIFNDIPELLLFPEYHGFEVIGIRITPNKAIIALFSSFVGLLKNYSK